MEQKSEVNGKLKERTALFFSKRVIDAKFKGSRCGEVGRYMSWSRFQSYRQEKWTKNKLESILSAFGTSCPLRLS